MKESRFIELLNLYVDQQLTAAEASELEAEIHGNRVRQQTYQQYCRMQKACSLLFEQERKEAPGSSALARAVRAADRKVVAFPAQRGSWARRGLYVSGLAAMAACVAVVLVRQGPTPAGSTLASDAGPISVAIVEPAVVATQPVVLPPADPSAETARASQYSLLIATRSTPADALVAGDALATDADEAQFDWMKRVDLPPLRRAEAEAWVFQTKPVVQPAREILAQPQRPTQGLYENAAFQFQK